MDEEVPAVIQALFAQKAPPLRTRNMQFFAHLGFIIISTILWSTVDCNNEYKNYPIQVHQMFQERVQHAGFGGFGRSRGNWGSWAAWSECSRSCGTGIQSQARDCVPMRTGYLRKRSIASIDGVLPEVKPFCVGTYKRYHVCNTQECPNFEDLRAQQCAKYNGKTYKGQSYQWEPFPDAPNECALNCRAVGERFYATLEPAVLDGTPCRGSSSSLRQRSLTQSSGGVLAGGAATANAAAHIADRWLCVAGQCKSVGCDGVVNSGRVLDACGVCGGEGNSCRLFEGIFLEPNLAKGYQLVTTIPKGAISLNVSELRPSSNTLAVRNSNNTFLVNGPESSSRSTGTYEGAGTNFTYHPGDGIHAENIWAEGPLRDSVDLMILSEELNPGILYKYMLPLNERIDESAMLAPPLLVAGPNDKIGNEIPDQAAAQLMMPPKPTRTRDNELETKLEDRKDVAVNSPKDSKILQHPHQNSKRTGITKMAGDQPMQTSDKNIPKKDQQQRRKNKKNKNVKKFLWKISGLSPCSKACGGGLQHATFKCFRENTGAMVPERRCKTVTRPPSPPPLRCNTRPCPARWRAGPWGSCSVTCGVGVQTRKLECVQELNPKLTMRVASGACIEKSDLKTTIPCKQISCISNRIGAPEPRQMQSQVVPTSGEPHWTTGPWETCSSTCGSGIRKRQVTCITSGPTCQPETRPPNETLCEGLPECKKITGLKSPWLFTDWSTQCSSECEKGVRTRQIACSDGNEVFCDVAKKPSTEKSCAGNGSACDHTRYQWFVGAWNPCSVTCGSGVQRRDVVCLSSRRGEVFRISEDKECSELTRPISEERCARPPCPAEWFTSDWTECTKSCGTGLQTRVVRCLREGLQSNECPVNSTEPKGRRLCERSPCSKSENQNPAKPPKKFHDKSDCVDKYPSCDLVVKAGLCRINYYKHSCCNCRGL